MRKTLLFALVVALGIQPSAMAVTGYRYWSFWIQNGSNWEMASAGAASTPAEAGSVQGWRFISAGVEPSLDLQPRMEPDFTEICGEMQKETHIAVVIDYGQASDYSAGEEPPAVTNFCVETENGKSAIMVLNEIVEIREESGFICALNQFPKSGCAEPISDADEMSSSTTQTELPESESNLLVNVAAFIGIATSAWFLRKQLKKQ